MYLEQPCYKIETVRARHVCIYLGNDDALTLKQKREDDVGDDNRVLSS